MNRVILALTLLLAGTLAVVLPGCKPTERQEEPAEPAAQAKEKPAGATEPRAETYWTCPMHPEVKEKEPGKCPICGMKLVEKKVGQDEASAPEKAQMKVVFTCGMSGHPQFELGKEPADGRCPQCGMKLVKKEISVPEEN
jgi:hypothetical protein